jgi:hypothetical protein
VPVLAAIIRLIAQGPMSEAAGETRGIRRRAVEKFSASMPEDHEPEEQTEGQGRDNEEVDGRDLVAARSQEGAPRAGRAR